MPAIFKYARNAAAPNTKDIAINEIVTMKIILAIHYKLLTFIYSQANFESKLVRQIPKACNAFNG